MKVAIPIPAGWRRVRSNEKIRVTDRRAQLRSGAVHFYLAEWFNHAHHSLVIRKVTVPPAPALPDETHPPKGWRILHKDTPLQPGDVFWNPQGECWTASFRAHSGNTRQIQSNTYARKK